MKGKITIFIVLCIALPISAGINVNSYLKEKEREKSFISSLYRPLHSAANHLYNCLYFNEAGDSDEAFKRLDNAYGEIVRADTLVRSFNYDFSNRYSMLGGSFEFLASYIQYQIGVINGVSITGIKADGVISDPEALFLTKLMDDLNIAVEKMSDESGYHDGVPEVFNPNVKLSLREVRIILDGFFKTWTWGSEDNPYLLLK